MGERWLQRTSDAAVLRPVDPRGTAQGNEAPPVRGIAPDARPPGRRGSARWRTISPTLVCGLLTGLDALAILLAGPLALLCYADHDYILRSWPWYLNLSLAGAAGMAALGRAGNLYRAEVLDSGFLRPWHAVGWWGATLFGLLGAIFFFRASADVSRGWVGCWLAIGMCGLGLVRIIMRRKIVSWRARGWMRRRVVVIGAPAPAARLIALLEQSPQSDYNRVVGAFPDDGGDIRLGAAPDPSQAVIAFLRDHAVETVMICCGSDDMASVNRLIHRLAELPVEVVVCRDHAGLTLPAMRAHLLGDVSLLQISLPPLGEWARVVKGLEDRIIASAMLLVLSPLLLLAALAIRLDSRGPVLFRQQRFGFNNRPISVLKFRSMHVDLQDVSGGQRTVRGDRRVTRVGRVMRATSIDELPQLWNVLRGEMSLVGPRAHPVMMRVTDQLYHEVVDGYAARHRVKPGITGLAQINGCRGEVDTIEKAHARIRYDLEYVSRWSLWLDLKILLLTPIRALHNGY